MEIAFENMFDRQESINIVRSKKALQSSDAETYKMVLGSLC